MKIKVNTVFGNLLFEGDFDSFAQAVFNNRANLINANLIDANLSGVNLSGANLIDANLSGANLSGANLRGANLIDANLRGVNLIGANLRGANLRGANLSDANLRGVNLSGANLCGVNLRGAKNAEYAIASTRILPDGGDIIGWKLCRDDVIVKLRIPEAAKRSHAFGRKCRAEYAVVLDVIGAKEGVSRHDSKFVYRVGETVKPTDLFSGDWSEECASGIHFFITRLEAEKYE